MKHAQKSRYKKSCRTDLQTYSNLLEDTQLLFVSHRAYTDKGTLTKHKNISHVCGICIKAFTTSSYSHHRHANSQFTWVKGHTLVCFKIVLWRKFTVTHIARRDLVTMAILRHACLYIRVEDLTNVIYVKSYLLSVAVLRDTGLYMLMKSHIYMVVTSHLLNIAVLHT